MWRSDRIHSILSTIVSDYDLPRDIVVQMDSLLGILKNNLEKVISQQALHSSQTIPANFETTRVFTGRPGRPKYQIDFGQVEGLVSLGFNWKQVAKLLSVLCFLRIFLPSLHVE